MQEGKRYCVQGTEEQSPIGVFDNGPVFAYLSFKNPVQREEEKISESIIEAGQCWLAPSGISPESKQFLEYPWVILSRNPDPNQIISII